jgi:hypothetical protein
MAVLSHANPKVLIGKTMQITSMVFYWVSVIWTGGAAPVRRPLFMMWLFFAIAGLVLILTGNHEEKKGKPVAGASGSVSLRFN